MIKSRLSHKQKKQSLRLLFMNYEKINSKQGAHYDRIRMQLFPQISQSPP